MAKVVCCEGCGRDTRSRTGWCPRCRPREFHVYERSRKDYETRQEIQDAQVKNEVRQIMRDLLN